MLRCTFPLLRGWQPSAKQRQRFTKAALGDARARHHAQREHQSLRQHVSESFGIAQRQRAELRRAYARAADELMARSKHSAEGRAAARELLGAQEEIRRTMRRGRRERTAAFMNTKQWRKR